jgi:hypothetical protein
MGRKRVSSRSRKSASSPQQLRGLRAHTSTQKQTTVDRLTAAITSLQAQDKPISIKTIRQECGLEYNSIKRNPEALLLYQQHSTFLKRQRKRTKVPQPDVPKPRDPLLAYKKADLAVRVRKAEELLKAQEQQHTTLLQDYVQKDIKIAELEAELAQHRRYLEGLRLTMQRQEHQGP